MSTVSEEQFRETRFEQKGGRPVHHILVYRVVDARQLEDGCRVEDYRVDSGEGLEQHQHHADHDGPPVRAHLGTRRMGRRRPKGGKGMRGRGREGGRRKRIEKALSEDTGIIEAGREHTILRGCGFCVNWHANH